MPSVIVNWSGRCPDRALQEGLCRQLGELAELSHGYFDEPRPTIRLFDQALEGRVILNGGLLGQDDLLVLQGSAIHGIEFRLYDGRNLYPGGDRISFVFLTSDDNPDANGLLVHVEDRERCAQYDHPRIRAAEWFLRTPRIHLRYYCEAWMDLLLGWVKEFYIPGLEYRRYERLSGYNEFQRIAREAGSGPEARDLLLKWLKHRFTEEVERWTDTAREARALWGQLDGSLDKDG